MILVIDNSKSGKNEKYKLFYKKEDIPESLLKSEVDFVNIEPISNNNKPISGFQDFYGC